MVVDGSSNTLVFVCKQCSDTICFACWGQLSLQAICFACSCRLYQPQMSSEHCLQRNRNSGRTDPSSSESRRVWGVWRGWGMGKPGVSKRPTQNKNRKRIRVPVLFLLFLLLFFPSVSVSVCICLWGRKRGARSSTILEKRMNQNTTSLATVSIGIYYEQAEEPSSSSSALL